MSKDNSKKRMEDINAGLTSLNNFMVEQTEINDYEGLIKTVAIQLDRLLNPVGAVLSDYDSENKELVIKELKANQGILDLAVRIGGKQILSTVTPVDAEMYESMTFDRVVLVPTLKEATGGAIPEPASSALGKALGINCCLILAYVLDGQLYGTTAVMLREQPQNYVIELLKTFTHFTAVSLKRIRSAQALRKSEEELKTVTNNMTDIVAMTDDQGIFTYLSGSHYRLLGYEPADLLGRSIFEMVHKDDFAQVLAKFEEAKKEGKNNKAVYRAIKKDGTYIWVETVGNILFDNKGQLSGGVFVTRDITDQKKAEDKIKLMSYHDQLTGLYNRHYFALCEQELKEIPVLSVIMTDINVLKLLNDTYGHQAGDELLIEYAKILKKSFENGDLIFRWGGDEFVVILKNIEEDNSWELCNRLIKNCEKTYVRDIPLSVSVGVASKLKGENLYKALTQAEDMMYRHKLAKSKNTKNLIMETLVKALSERSHETQEHIERMKSVGVLFGKRLSLSPADFSKLNTLIMLHDIGLINIDSQILLKDSELTGEEYEEIWKHPEVGYRIVCTSEDFACIAEEVLTHHERWDGQGYPMGVKDNIIPYLSRIFSLVDSYDVMRNGRPYKEQMSTEEIIAEVERCSGKQFDPDLAEEFVACLREGVF